MALIETNFIRPQEAYDRNTGESKVRYRSYDGNDRFIPVMEGENGVPKTLVEVAHAELKAMRDAGKLTAGALYRITDYQCTTTQENTQSAGHQFDIVLLALSENKLAEEGWAMMHDNIYDVTFNDGVVRKCYIYIVNDENCNVVLCDTLLGIDGVVPNDELIINETEKTATLELYDIENLDIENLPYNYFQNSNLSAWKVWYCLDNDKSRFAWADDSLDEGSPASIMVHSNKGDTQYERDATQDIEGFYAWTNIHMITYFTNTETPSTNDVIYSGIQSPIPTLSILYYTPAHEGTGLPNGRGVIYRLIDEWNNDCPYDFKNIQFVRPMTDGGYDPDEGEDTLCYTFSLTQHGDVLIDASIGYWQSEQTPSLSPYAFNNYISPFIDGQRFLTNNVFVGDDVKNGIRLYECDGITLSNHHNVSLYNVYDKSPDEVDADSIYIGDKKVLTEE